MEASMSLAQNSGAYCVAEKKPCVGWVEKYFKDCLCNISDDFSFVLGLVSLVCWGVAEIPQIVTNFRTKSSHGVSLLFLLTWIAGDIFNLVGCLLEPATLPTQLYTALVDEAKKPLRQRKSGGSGIPIPDGASRAARPHQVDYYYTSARSMAGSATPPFRTNLWLAKSGPSALGMDNDCSSDDETVEAPSMNSISQPKPIPRSAGYGAFLTTSLSIPHQTKALMPVYAALGGRKLLQESGTEHSSFGQWLGWMMAAIYMGGRIPQIWLNIKRGSVEGLNPLMFIFALMANATYVGSILVRTTAWDKIKPNLPWLLDAAVCVGLDIFIILQYIYYRYCRKNSGGSREDSAG
ncbi:probable vacuolar amino acid transporter YPQ1 isoform X2 [Ipomoea triloba]|uniref:probable vacuolar amino acid transporter YPQ1 isoform X2 n=1 Tax=Ipomoea triloba TaxID=35885 RepID=UPI00125DF40F|nr:probable vacuolar amino acid transporter YPQ1 isoform X2 [Ipomoea triloba]